ATFIALLVHEMGHFLAARALRVPVLQIAIGFGPQLLSIHLFGCNIKVAVFPLSASTSYGQHPRGMRASCIAAAGPCASVLLAAAALMVVGLPWRGEIVDWTPALESHWASACLVTSIVSSTIALFNMVPFWPLDGDAILTGHVQTAESDGFHRGLVLWSLQALLCLILVVELASR